MTVWAFPSFYPYDFPGMQWAGIFAHRQYKGLIANGAQVNVVVPVLWNPAAPFYNFNKQWQKWAEYNFPAERVYDGIKVFHPRIKNMKPGRLFPKPYSERYIEAIVRFFKSKQIHLDPSKDIFYSQWLLDAGLVQIAAHQLGVKSAVLGIGDDILIWPQKNDSNKRFLDKTLTEADLRCSVAQYLADEANKLIGKELPFQIIRRGVNYDFFTPVPADEKAATRQTLGLPGDKMIILTVGAAIVAKGWMDLFDALKELKANNIDFVLAAVYGGNSELNIKEEAVKRGLGDDLIDLKEVPPDKMNMYYNAADIFCLPSHTEGIANAVAEAMSCGLPVITTTVGGHRELIKDHENGILIAPKDVPVLTEQLKLLINDADLRKQLGFAAREHIVSHWGNFAQNSKKLYEVMKQKLNNT